MNKEKQIIYFDCNKQQWGNCSCVDECRRGNPKSEFNKTLKTIKIKQ